MLQLLAIPGSLRRSSYNRRLLVAAAERAPATMTVKLFYGLRAIPLFDEDVEAEGLPVAVHRLRDEVVAADGLLVATPEYNQSVPGVLKNAIDWLSRCEGALAGKPIAVIGATTGPWGTRLAQSALRHVFNATGSLVMPHPALYVRNAGALFDSAGRLIDPATGGALDAVLAALARWIRRTRDDTRDAEIA